MVLPDDCDLRIKALKLALDATGGCDISDTLDVASKFLAFLTNATPAASGPKTRPSGPRRRRAS
jgi:hypothetical protein